MHIYVEPKYMFVGNLVQIGLVVWTLELVRWLQTYFLKTTFFGLGDPKMDYFYTLGYSMCEKVKICILQHILPG